MTILAALSVQAANRWVPAMLVAVIAGSIAAWLIAQHAPAGWPQLATVKARCPAHCRRCRCPTCRSTRSAAVRRDDGDDLLALTEAVAIARALASSHGDKLDGNQEFIGQGLANLAGAFFSAYPASGSFNRSGVNVASGAQTPLSAICSAMFLIAILFFVAPLVRFLPYAVIAALLFLVAWGLIDRREIARIWREEPDRAGRCWSP